MNFPKAEAVTEITTLAQQFRAAAARLDEIATSAPGLEIGTLRRQANVVRFQIANALSGAEE